MNRGETEALAAEFVLGTLDGQARQGFARALERDRDLQALVADWERRLAPLDHGTKSIAPPAALWDRIDAAIHASDPARQALTVRRAEGRWQDLGDGVEKKVLFKGRTEGFETYLLRLAPGSLLPRHDHKIAEDCMVLEGTVSVGALRLAAGDYHMAPAGTWHSATAGADGALLYIRGELHSSAK